VNFQILLFANDANLSRELKAALATRGFTQPVIHEVADFRQAVESVRSRHPEIALVEMDHDLRTLKAFADEVTVESPETGVIGVFRPEIFGPEVSESLILIEALRAGVRDFLRRPVSSADLEQLLTRLFERRAVEPRRLGHIVSMISNKGGVGKSTLAVNTAAGLAVRNPGRTLLIDASLQMGVCASMLDLQPTLTLLDALRERDRLDETLIRQLATPHACGLHLLAAPQNAVDAAEIDDEVISRVLTLARRAYDFVIVDTFPLLDRVVMAVLDLSDRVYLITENVVPTLLSTAKLVELLNGLGFDATRQRIVLNRYESLTGSLKPVEVAQRLGRTVDHVVPYHKSVMTAANLGRPYVLSTNRFSTPRRRTYQLIQDVEQVQGPPLIRIAETNGRGAAGG
jgi:pilus assembly protein CpaE